MKTIITFILLTVSAFGFSQEWKLHSTYRDTMVKCKGHFITIEKYRQYLKIPYDTIQCVMIVTRKTDARVYQKLGYQTTNLILDITQYFDLDKKPLSKLIIVWQSKLLKDVN